MKTHSFTGDLYWSRDIGISEGCYQIKPSVPEKIRLNDKIIIQEQVFMVSQYLGGIGKLTPVGGLKKMLRVGKTFINLYPEDVKKEVFDKPSYDPEARTVIVGWQCPKCLTINSPWMPMCGNDSCEPIQPLSFVVEEGEEKEMAEFLASQGFKNITAQVLRDFIAHLEKAATEFVDNKPGILKNTNKESARFENGLVYKHKNGDYDGAYFMYFKGDGLRRLTSDIETTETVKTVLNADPNEWELEFKKIER